MRRRASALALALGALALAAAAAAAGQAEPELRLPKGPIKITAERADLERREVALYRGNVRLVSAEIELSGDRLELRQPAKGQYQARLTGRPARLKHMAVADAPPVAASAGEIVYDTRTALVEMSGGASLTRGTDVVSSDSIRYNLAARRISATGRGGKQVEITIQPPPGATDGQNTSPFPRIGSGARKDEGDGSQR
jgi:lipopolysaccharide export system protein LptA